MSESIEVPEAKSLRWLANMFSYVEQPQNETDRMCNAIHLYCSAGADKIEELCSLLEAYKQRDSEGDAND